MSCVTSGRLHRFTLRELMRREELSSRLSQVALRCELQLARLGLLPPRRPVSLLTGLLQDTRSAASGLPRLSSPEAGRRLLALCSRHGLFVETLSDLCFEAEEAADLAHPLLATQSSLTALLEQASSVLSPRHGEFVRRVDLGELCRSARDHAVSVAEHSEGWCPRVELSLAEAEELVAIPSRTQFVVVELLKNAISSTMTRHRDLAGTLSEEAIARVPPVTLSLTFGAAGAVVSVADSGVGVSGEVLAHVHRFLHFSRQRAR